ncbi:MAG: hypothetical protein IT472_09425 [Thermomonas sp.]|uniref:hypothetical protein n=1 Tax=Thermomonas sp. TaxID=1971895 RepID=UPI0026357E9F|nr:hypothetical protein [Thermomonas sp.]MCC7097383.1 hypothetical protein [Thermomonas sp.]
MHWLFLLLAFAAMVSGFLTTSMAVLSACIVAALVLFLLWVLGMYQTHVAGSGRDTTAMIDPAELRRLRELAQERRAEEAKDPPP